MLESWTTLSLPSACADRRAECLTTVARISSSGPAPSLCPPLFLHLPSGRTHRPLDNVSWRLRTTAQGPASPAQGGRACDRLLGGG